jgi:hypothetical protein
MQAKLSPTEERFVVQGAQQVSVVLFIFRHDAELSLLDRRVFSL